MKQTFTFAKSRLSFFTVAANSSLSFVSLTYNQKVEYKIIYHHINLSKIFKLRILQSNMQAISQAPRIYEH